MITQASELANNSGLKSDIVSHKYMEPTTPSSMTVLNNHPNIIDEGRNENHLPSMRDTQESAAFRTEYGLDQLALQEDIISNY